MQTFSGADADLRFARDDAGDDLILRDRDLHSHVPQPTRTIQSEPGLPNPPVPPTEDEDADYGRDDREDEIPPKQLGY